MIYAIALCLYVLCYLVIQVMFLFYGCHISQHKRKVFVILVVYTILFKGMDFLLLSPDPSAMPTTTYWVYWSVHTLDTFILIFLMAVYADGTLGRNLSLIHISSVLGSVKGSVWSKSFAIS